MVHRGNRFRLLKNREKLKTITFKVKINNDPQTKPEVAITFVLDYRFRRPPQLTKYEC